MDKHPVGNQNRIAAIENSGRYLLVFMTVLGYVITFFVNSGEHGVTYTFPELFWGISFGLFYLLWGFNQSRIIRRLPSGWGTGIFMLVGTGLVFGIGWELGPGGNWLAGLPLAAMAVDTLTPKRRWLVYLALIMAGILPIARYSNWASVINNSFIIGAAILFVVGLTQALINEQQARKRTEQLMAELEDAHNRLAAYAAQVEELATTQERNRLAREIHDSLGHYLTIINVQIEAARAVFDTEPDRALDAINKAQKIAQKGLARVRESVTTLRESPVGNRSLDEAIASLVRDMQRTGIVSEFKIAGKIRPLENKVALNLYRVAQEALTNVRKHAHASRVDVLLDLNRPGEVRLVIKDNGVGATETTGGFGLVGVRERLQLLGGKIEIQTQVGQGFCLEATVPIAAMGESFRPREGELI